MSTVAARTQDEMILFTGNGKIINLNVFLFCEFREKKINSQMKRGKNEMTKFRNACNQLYRKTFDIYTRFMAGASIIMKMNTFFFLRVDGAFDNNPNNNCSGK